MRVNTSTSSVSVCIPTYKGARYLGEAIASVLSQTLTDLELIVVDDCSDDDAEAIVKSFRDERITFFQNPVRLGLVGNWNKCVELSSGQFVCVFHQDDVMLAQNLAEKVKILEEHPRVGLVHSNVSQIGPEGEHISEWWYSKPDPRHDGVHVGPEYFKLLFSGLNIVCCPSVVVRRECFEELGGFDSRLPFTADWEMWMRIALSYDIAYLVETLVKYRRHAGMETANFLGVEELEHSYRAKLLILEKHPDRIQEADTLKRNVVKEYKQQALAKAIHHYRERQYAQARQYVTFGAKLHASELEGAPCGAKADWFREVIEQMWPSTTTARFAGPSLGSKETEPPQPAKYQTIHRQVVDRLSGEEIAQQISIRTLIKAMAFKVATKPGFRWLYRYRELGKSWIGG